MLKTYHVAQIDEASCIGCTKCLQACPVAAIIGANKQMHTVLTELCIGCDLCLPPCPVDCISLSPISLTSEMRKKQASEAKQRHQAQKQRLNESKMKKHQADLEKTALSFEESITAAIARAKQKKIMLLSS